MSRWRCLSCEGEYDDLSPGGVPYFHVCPPVMDPATGELTPRPGHRDENIVQEFDQEDRRKSTVHMKAEGRGRTPVHPGPPGPPAPPAPPGPP